MTFHTFRIDFCDLFVFPPLSRTGLSQASCILPFSSLPTHPGPHLHEYPFHTFSTSASLSLYNSTTWWSKIISLKTPYWRSTVLILVRYFAKIDDSTSRRKSWSHLGQRPVRVDEFVRGLKMGWVSRGRLAGGQLWGQRV